MSQKFGPDRYKQIEAMMKQRFIDTGLPEPTSDMLIRQTTRSHRLVWKAGQVGGPQLQNTVVGALYEKHFIDGGDVGDIEGYLSEVALDNALFNTKADAVEWFDGEEGLPEYQEAIKKAQRMGISGVPFWTYVLVSTDFVSLTLALELTASLPSLVHKNPRRSTRSVSPYGAGLCASDLWTT